MAELHSISANRGVQSDQQVQLLCDRQSPRCRLACYAYIARFEWLLDTIEREDYLLRSQYNERKSAGAGLRMGWLTLSSVLRVRGIGALPQPDVSQPVGKL